MEEARSVMPKETFPSSYECDCGHQSHFFENTIREVKAMSRRKEARLVDSASDEHAIVFYKELISGMASLLLQ
jgi:hypothetical protein